MKLGLMPLTDEQSIPLLGFGTGTTWYKDNPDDPFNTELVEALKTAIGKGFIHLDCADCYGTEREVGVAIKQSGLPREKFFIATKVQDGWADAPKAMEKSLEDLQLEYVDLYLLHNPYIIPTPEDLQKAWKGVEAVKKAGKAKSIGVSNMQRAHIETILEVATEIPSINQIEFHPYLQRANNYIPWLREKGIEVSAFKSLAPITVGKGGPLDGPLERIALSHGVSADAIILRWTMDQNVIPITTTGKSERMDEYLTAIDLRLTAEELEEITQTGLTHHFRWWGKSFVDPEDRS